jgi:hypothetical protein
MIWHIFKKDWKLLWPLVRIPAKSTSDSNRKAPPIPGESIQ